MFQGAVLLELVLMGGQEFAKQVVGGECVQWGMEVCTSQPDSVLEQDIDTAGAHSGDIIKP